MALSLFIPTPTVHILILTFTILYQIRLQFDTVVLSAGSNTDNAGTHEPQPTRLFKQVMPPAVHA